MNSLKMAQTLSDLKTNAYLVAKTEEPKRASSNNSNVQVAEKN